MSFAIRFNKDYYKLTFNYKTENQNISSVTTPYPDLPIHFDIFINNTQVKTTTYGSQFLNQLSNRFISFWNQLDYDTLIHISDDSLHSFDLNLKCKVFSNYATSNHLQSIWLTLIVLTHDEYVSIEDLLIKFDYLLVSWFLHAESCLPLVFSCIGRKFVKMNTFWYRRCRRDILGHDSFEIDNLLPSLVSKIMQELILCKLLQHSGKLLSVSDNPLKNHSIIRAFSIRLINY